MRGYTQALEIMAMENILRELEVDRFGVSTGDFRSQDLYYVSFFGRPSFEDTWAWRFLGHHLSLSYTIVGQRWLSVTPCNMGANRPRWACSVRFADEDLGFEILHGLGDAQRKQAIIHHVAPADYTTRQVPRREGRVSRLPRPRDQLVPDQRRRPRGAEVREGQPAASPDRNARRSSAQPRRPRRVVCGAAATRGQRSLHGPHQERRPREALVLLGGWPGERTPHYYRIQGADILIEFDNAIDNGNHIHSVWRDYRADLGHQLLLDHYEHERHHGHHLDTRLKSSVPEDD
jgi:hypothetical protein